MNRFPPCRRLGRPAAHVARQPPDTERLLRVYTETHAEVSRLRRSRPILRRVA
jgi:hypothetical protein